MEKYVVTGMNCAACSARVEKAVTKVEGVTSVSVNLLTGMMAVEGSAKSKDIIAAVTAAGYGARIDDDELNHEDNTEKKIKLRLIFSVIIVVPLMYLQMFAKFEYPKWIPAVMALAVMIINRRFFISGFKGIIHGAPNMDTLVALGSAASFIYGYYDSAAMILALITVGKLLEARSKGKTTDAIKSLMKLTPQIDIKVGEEFEIKPGESIPADAVVIEGSSAVDESALTGESIPVDKEAGSTVSAGTLNTSGYLKCRALRVGKDTTLSQIIKTVSDASATKAPIAKTADKVAGVFVPVVIGIAVVTFAVWMLSGYDVSFALQRAVSVLVISCPCALGLATPVAIMVGSGLGAKNGILFKTAVSLEQAGKTQIAVLDKTGTITKGSPEVTDVFAVANAGLSEDVVLTKKFLELAAALEAKSEHPLAKAIVKKYDEEKNESSGLKSNSLDIKDFESLTGSGVSATADGRKIYGGSATFISGIADLTQEIKDRIVTLYAEGKTPVLFSDDKTVIGIIALRDTEKPDSKEAISQLRQMGIRTVMLTGDNETTAKAIAGKAGVDKVIAGVLPNQKDAVIQKLQSLGKVMMVGDGINDAPALTRADTGVAIGAGTDVAIDAADIVLMKSSLLDVPAAIRLSRAVLKNIKENLFWAFFYNIIGIPLAAGAFYPIFGWVLSPMFGAAAMSISSFFVVSNALRLNLKKIYDAGHDRKVIPEVSTEEIMNVEIKNDSGNNKESKKMIKTRVEVEGMMCPNCERHNSEALREIAGVTEVVSSHEKKEAIITSEEHIDEAVIRAAVEKAGYKPGAITEI